MFSLETRFSLSHVRLQTQSEMISLKTRFKLSSSCSKLSQRSSHTTQRLRLSESTYEDDSPSRNIQTLPTQVNLSLCPFVSEKKESHSKCRERRKSANLHNHRCCTSHYSTTQLEKLLPMRPPKRLLSSAFRVDTEFMFAPWEARIVSRMIDSV